MFGVKYYIVLYYIIMFIYILHPQTPAADVCRNRHDIYLYASPRRPINIFLFRLMRDVIMLHSRYKDILPKITRRIDTDDIVCQ